MDRLPTPQAATVASPPPLLTKHCKREVGFTAQTILITWIKPAQISTKGMLGSEMSWGKGDGGTNQLF